MAFEAENEVEQYEFGFYSSNISYGVYDYTDEVLQVGFKGGGVYEYDAVPADVWES